MHWRARCDPQSVEIQLTLRILHEKFNQSQLNMEHCIEWTRRALSNNRGVINKVARIKNIMLVMP